MRTFAFHKPKQSPGENLLVRRLPPLAGDAGALGCQSAGEPRHAEPLHLHRAEPPGHQRSGRRPSRTELSGLRIQQVLVQRARCLPWFKFLFLAAIGLRK